MYQAKIIADSVSEATGQRITTFELVYWRAIHAELVTHRVFTRNAASSRAIPVKKALALIEENPARPIHWGKNQRGMQANEEQDAEVNIDLSWLLEGLTYKLNRREAWDEARNFAVSIARGFSKAEYHKQIVNRLTEPFQYIKTVVTATSYDNWYWLRNHPDAQPEIQHLAEMMYYEAKASPTKVLTEEEWHVPYYYGGVWTPHFEDERGNVRDSHGNTLETALKISSSCCAQTSFRLNDPSENKAENIYKTLVESKPVHASPFEHQAKPLPSTDGNMVTAVNNMMNIEGVTHIDKKGRLNSGNFCNWLQHRQLIPENACEDYEASIA